MRQIFTVIDRVKLYKPLARVTMLSILESKVFTYFQYKRLLGLCYFYGVLLHGAYGCTSKTTPTSSSQPPCLQYGPWLRVSSSRPHSTFSLSFGERSVFPMMPRKSQENLEEKGSSKLYLFIIFETSFSKLYFGVIASRFTFQFTRHSVLEKISST